MAERDGRWLARPPSHRPAASRSNRSGSGCGARCGGWCGVPGEQMAVVSHVTPIKLMLRDALAAGDTFMHRLFLDPAGLSIVDYWPDGGIAVRPSTTPPTSPASDSRPHHLARSLTGDSTTSPGH